ncbi:MAG: hypothetical protein AB7N65_12255 [Vicinamibacterales bacterium]
MPRWCVFGLTLTLLLAASPVCAAVRLTIVDGLVHLAVDQATIAEVLAEWERVGQTRIVNAEQLGAERVTLQLSGVPEGQALDILLRSAGGYVAAERTGPARRLSRFHQILVLPARRPPNSAAPPSSSPSTPLLAPAALPASPPLLHPDDRVMDDGREDTRPATGEATPSPLLDPIGAVEDVDGRTTGGAVATGPDGPGLRPAQALDAGPAPAGPGSRGRAVVGVPRPGMPTPSPTPAPPPPDPNGRF